MGKLEDYRRKRDFVGSPEPLGEDSAPVALSKNAWRSFVVQQHDARNMHWDLRLEVDGVLASWAIPKGPTLDPSDKRLAVRTEDHPMEYMTFEGVIPEGEYGAGAMIVWDSGSYRIVDGLSPAEGMETGKLDLLMRGVKLSGRFALVRTKQAGEKHWLFIRKGQPPEPGPELIETHRESVLSGLTVAELAEAGDVLSAREPELLASVEKIGAKRRVLPAKLSPMLAEPAEEPFSSPGWIFEVKHDGVRVIARKTTGGVTLTARSGRDATATYPEIAEAVGRLAVSEVTLDGEVVALDESGGESFPLLQHRLHEQDPAAVARCRVEIPVRYRVFDLLSLGGFDLRDRLLRDRKSSLTELVPSVGLIELSDHVEEQGEVLFELAREHGREGIVAKKLDSRYEAARRAKSWLKIKVREEAPMVVVGWEEGKGHRAELGSLLLAWWHDGKLMGSGKAGSGLRDDDIAHLTQALPPLEVDRPPHEGEPIPRHDRHFVEPLLCVQVAYAEILESGQVRFPVFLRMRDDLQPSDCVMPAPPEPVREVAAKVVQAPELVLTRREKVFFPDDGLTKGDLLDYYRDAWPFLSPYLADRPVVLVRYPDGINGKSFFQKHAPDFVPDWVRTRKLEGEDTEGFLCDDLRSLLYLVNLGAIPLHVPASRLSAPDRPDWLSLDLDPKDAPWKSVIAVARRLHELLDDCGAPHVVKTSGQSGLHVLVPLDGSLDHAGARSVAEVIAKAVVSELPDIATVVRPIAARGDKVYLDYMQNGGGKLVVAPLSVRPRPGAPVSTPLTWGRVTNRLDPSKLGITKVLTRLKKEGDPFREVLEGPKADVGALLDGLTRRMGG
ncbi:MAG: DNA ligase D [Acidobacteriota bacterium]